MGWYFEGSGLKGRGCGRDDKGKMTRWWWWWGGVIGFGGVAVFIVGVHIIEDGESSVVVG